MRVILAGYNVDSTVLAEAEQLGIDRDRLTPEPISAAYARISRHKKPVDQLRARARDEVAKARRSNRSIIFGMGHHSVAEHAVFNFDLIGTSRLAIEAVEGFRLCSFTEKSQRYITLDGDYVVPREVEDAGLADEFHALVARQNELYGEILEAIVADLRQRHPEEAETKAGMRRLHERAKEDARYVTALATEGQLGMTINARNLEHAIRRFACHPLQEIRELGRALHDQVEPVAPSLILFVDENQHDLHAYRDIASVAAGLEPPSDDAPPIPGASPAQRLPNGGVRLVGASDEADRRLVAALLHRVSTWSYEECYRRACAMSQDARRKVVGASMAHMELFDAVLREFEHVEMTFELVVCAACYGQLKRHRMSTQTAQAYDPDLGLTIPPSVVRVGLEQRVEEVARESEQLAARIAEHTPCAAPYALMNAHRRRVLMTLNARELYHVSRLREDEHAQWDIRALTAEMVRQAKDAMPLTLVLTGGKDTYPERFEALFGRAPQVVAPEPP